MEKNETTEKENILNQRTEAVLSGEEKKKHNIRVMSKEEEKIIHLLDQLSEEEVVGYYSITYQEKATPKSD